jgi:hypothetical protein
LKAAQRQGSAAADGTQKPHNCATQSHLSQRKNFAALNLIQHIANLSNRSNDSGTKIDLHQYAPMQTMRFVLLLPLREEANGVSASLSDCDHR